jgi:hypothetical protein
MVTSGHLALLQPEFPDRRREGVTQLEPDAGGVNEEAPRRKSCRHVSSPQPGAARGNGICGDSGPTDFVLY